MHALLKTIQRTIHQHQLLKPSEHTLVALSGGADSVCLLLALKELGYSVEALHCNFHLRGEESDRDEHFVRQLCQEHAIPLHIKHFDTRAYAQINKVSIEMAARDLRYQWFAQMLEELNIPSICVAHHQQDQAETLLLNLLRGTGLRGLAAMPYKHLTPRTALPSLPLNDAGESSFCDAGASILRPMLDVRKDDIEQYLTDRNQTWVTDSTNLERDALRNRIRLDVLPLLRQINPQAISNITHTATIVQETLPYLESTLRTVEADALEDQCIEASNLTELYEAVRPCTFTRQQLQDILSAKTGAIIQSATHRLLRDRNAFILRNNQHVSKTPQLSYETISCEENEEHPIHFEQGAAYFDADTLRQPLSVRPVLEGDRMQPFGMKGTRLLSDIMTDLKLNRFQKEDQHVLIDANNHILWLIGHRTSNLCKVTTTTKTILKITLQQLPQQQKQY